MQTPQKVFLKMNLFLQKNSENLQTPARVVHLNLVETSPDFWQATYLHLKSWTYLDMKKNNSSMVILKFLELLWVKMIRKKHSFCLLKCYNLLNEALGFDAKNWQMQRIDCLYRTLFFSSRISCIPYTARVQWKLFNLFGGRRVKSFGTSVLIQFHTAE